MSPQTEKMLTYSLTDAEFKSLEVTSDTVRKADKPNLKISLDLPSHFVGSIDDVVKGVKQNGNPKPSGHPKTIAYGGKSEVGIEFSGKTPDGQFRIYTATSINGKPLVGKERFQYLISIKAHEESDANAAISAGELEKVKRSGLELHYRKLPFAMCSINDANIKKENGVPKMVLDITVTQVYH